MKTKTGFLCAVLMIAAGASLTAAPPASGIDISDAPMFARILPPPANVMFLMDDSTSMQFEILLDGPGAAPSGMLPSPEPTVPAPFAHIFPNYAGYNFNETAYRNLDGTENIKLWKTRCHRFNKLYYNPASTYAPWPGFPEANEDKPRSYPGCGSICTDAQKDATHAGLDQVSFSVPGAGGASVAVPASHYFVYALDGGAFKPYLVAMKKEGGGYSIKYYEAQVEGTGFHEKVTKLTPVSLPPDGVAPPNPDPEFQRRNFANWYSYYRKRAWVAKNALAKVILNLAQVRVGIYGINGKIVKPLAKVKVSAPNGSVTDKTGDLLDALFGFKPVGATPLKSGLYTVGRYFEVNDGKLGNVQGTEIPYDKSGAYANCQQSFTVIISDGYYTGETDFPDVGNRDGAYGHPFKDSYSKTLADIAMYFYDRDLHADLDDRVPTSKFDSATHQHVSTFGVAFGVKGTLNPNDYDALLKHKTTGEPVVWPEPVAQAPSSLDDLWHATVNGRGQFYSASDPEEFNEAMKSLLEAFAEILIGSSASVTVNGDDLHGKISGSSVLYQATYSNDKGEWVGDIKAYPLDPATGKVKFDQKLWSAAEKLEPLNWDGRIIATHNGAAGIPFRHDNLTQGQRDLLGANPDAKVKYLRGIEVSGFRARSQKLGDIVSASPVYADETLYVGANDGMLHAFNAVTGVERFAYVPNLVFPNLKLLADPGYVHKFFVDLAPTVKKGVTLFGVPDRSLLVGGLRGGGKGYFALDVTAPATITSEGALKNRVLWEFPTGADPDMGFSFSKPVIVKSNSSTYPWVVITGNGYNSASGKSVLFVLDAGNGAVVARLVADAGPGNGLSSPLAVDVSYDEKVDFVYAGDLQGKLWKFDLTDGENTKWGVAYKEGATPAPLFQARGPSGSAQPITTRPDAMYHPEKQGFLVCFGTGKYLGDADFTDQSVQSIYGVWDFGDRVYRVKAAGTQPHWSDDDDGEFLGVFNRGAAAKLSKQPAKVGLLNQTLKDVKVGIGSAVATLRFLSSHKPAWITEADTAGQEPNPSSSVNNHAGYHIDLPAGERVISDVLIRNGLLIAIGFIPNADACGPGGNSMLMEINAFTGGSPYAAVFDVNKDRIIDNKDLVKVEMDGFLKDMPPVGVLFQGNLQPPAILRLSGPADVEMKYMSSSTGVLETLLERAARLGVTYWMEVRY